MNKRNRKKANIKKFGRNIYKISQDCGVKPDLAKFVVDIYIEDFTGSQGEELLFGDHTDSTYKAEQVVFLNNSWSKKKDGLIFQ